MKVKFAEDRDTFTIEELLGEDGVIELKALLQGYKVERIKEKGNKK